MTLSRKRQDSTIDPGALEERPETACRKKQCAKDQGFIIVAVLWILAALAAFVSIYAVYVINTAVASRASDDRLEAQALITAGLELTAYRLSAANDEKGLGAGGFGFRLGRAEVAVRFLSEGARIDLNAARKELLIGFFGTLGVGPEQASFYADRINGWRSKPKAATRNEELEAYQRAGLSYGPRQAPFQSVGELRLIQGLPSSLVDRMLPFVTVYNGQAGIDIMVAPPEILAALPDMSQAKIAEIIAVRARGEPRAVTDLVGPSRADVAIGNRKATRIAVRVRFDKGREINAEVVILLMEDGPDPYRILTWYDDFEGL